MLDRAIAELDFDVLLAVWRETEGDWKRIADGNWKRIVDSLIQVACNLAEAGNREKGALVLSDLADGLVSGSTVCRDREFGVPDYPMQSFMSLACFLRVGRKEEGTRLLADWEKEFRNFPDEAKIKYWAYDGWTFLLGNLPDIAANKFEKAVSTAISIQPPNIACEALVQIAAIIRDGGGSTTESLRLLDIAAEQTDMRGATFLTRHGAIPQTTQEHKVVADQFNAQLQKGLGSARYRIQLPRQKDRVFLGYLLEERGKKELHGQLLTGDVLGGIQAVRHALQHGQERPFDLVLMLSACAVALYETGR